MPTFTADQLAQQTRGDVRGNGSAEVSALATLEHAGPGDLTFIGDPAYADRWAHCHATAALVSRAIADDATLAPRDGQALIVVDNADLAMAAVLEDFAVPDPRPGVGVHSTAVVHETATLGRDVAIGPHCVVGPNVTIGDRCALHAGCHVYDHAVLGDDCVLWPGVVVRERCTLGKRCVLHSHVVIGTDGFGYRPDTNADGQPTIRKVPHLGHVELGNDCELGACACVDKGKFTPTMLGHGCKLDNHVQIGHNCRLGNMVIISGCTAIAGSCTVGDGVMIGGQAAIADHLTIGAGAQLAGGIQLMNDVPPGERWAGSPGKPMSIVAREKVAIAKLPEVMRQVKKMMKQ